MITRYPSGTIKSYKWIVDGKLHNTDGPALIEWDCRGVKRLEIWKINGEFHHAGAPAYQKWSSRGKLEEEGWSIIHNGESVEHRIGGPAYREWNDDIVTLEEWYYLGKEHRENRPAYIIRDANGEITHAQWRHHGRLHRLDGPCWYAREKSYTSDNHCEWYIDGCPTSKSEAKKILRPREFKAVVALLPQPIAEEMWYSFHTLTKLDMLENFLSNGLWE